jgi:hypothetical protein
VSIYTPIANVIQELGHTIQVGWSIVSGGYPSAPLTRGYGSTVDGAGSTAVVVATVAPVGATASVGQIRSAVLSGGIAVVAGRAYARAQRATICRVSAYAIALVPLLRAGARAKPSSVVAVASVSSPVARTGALSRLMAAGTTAAAAGAPSVHAGSSARMASVAARCTSGEPRIYAEDDTALILILLEAA